MVNIILLPCTRKMVENAQNQLRRIQLEVQQNLTRAPLSEAIYAYMEGNTTLLELSN